MENVNSDLERLAKIADAEDKPMAPDDQGKGGDKPVGGDHLPADVAKLREEKAKARAVQLVGLLDWALKKKDARLVMPMEAYDEAPARLAPVMLKHGMDEFGLPDWLAPHKEELSALVFFVGLGYGIGMQVYELRKADQAAAQAGTGASDQGAPVEDSPFAFARGEG